MSANSEEIVQQLRADFEGIIMRMLPDHSQPRLTADAMERNLWKSMLQIGRGLMTAFLVHRAEMITPAHVCLSEEQVLPSHDQSPRTYDCVFGKIRFERRYYYRAGQGAFPADADLNLPPNGCSDLLREWQERFDACVPYDDTNALLEQILGRPFSTRAQQAAILEDGPQVEAFYEQAEAKGPDPDACILVVQADGKGVPLVRPADPDAPVRAGKGAPAGKKEAIVTSVYTLRPAPRTPESVVASLFHADTKQPPAPEERGKPYDKWLWATLEGKDAALTLTAEQARRREGEHILHRVALTDGAEALQTRVQSHFPHFTLLLDFIHANEYLWKAANALLGENAPERDPWVEERTLLLLEGQTAAVICDLRQTASACQDRPVVSKTLASVAAYYERNQPLMRYDLYLARGWPIASGVIEGACRHLVKDRCEQSGMRWTQAGAEALLHLRSVAENGNWEPFHAYRRRQRQLQLYTYWKAEQPDITAMPLRLAA